MALISAGKAEARLNETHHGKPQSTDFLDSILFIVNSSRFLWVSLATEKMLSTYFTDGAVVNIFLAAVINSSRLLRVSLATGKTIC